MYRILLIAARVTAAFGGIVLSVAILITATSIIGRTIDQVFHADWLMGWAPGLAEWLIALGLGPINGDFELVMAGMAFAIFSFIPLCQISGSHATVDVFTSMMSLRVNRVLRAIAECLFAAALVVIALQLYGGMTTKLRSGQTTFLLEMPEWWGYALCLPGAFLAAIIGVYLAIQRVAEVILRRDLLPADMEAEE